VRNQFCCGIVSWRHRIPREGIEDFGIVGCIVVYGGRHPYMVTTVNTFPTRKQYGTCRQGLKSRHLLYKITFFGAWWTQFHSWFLLNSSAEILEQSIRARNREGIGLSYWPARLHRRAESIPWIDYLPSQV
jgi:hypothetical protein